MTGKTYHLAPLLVAAAPGVLSRALQIPPRGMVVAGGVTALAGWAAILAAGIEPSATLWASQPGGVRLETVLFLVLGTAIGAGRGPMWVARRVRRRRRSG